MDAVCLWMKRACNSQFRKSSGFLVFRYGTLCANGDCANLMWLRAFSALFLRCFRMKIRLRDFDKSSANWVFFDPSILEQSSAWSVRFVRSVRRFDRELRIQTHPTPVKCAVRRH